MPNQKFKIVKRVKQSSGRIDPIRVTFGTIFPAFQKREYLEKIERSKSGKPSVTDILNLFVSKKENASVLVSQDSKIFTLCEGSCPETATEKMKDGRGIYLSVTFENDFDQNLFQQKIIINGLNPKKLYHPRIAWHPYTSR
jgi:hypothetical protein